MNNETKDETICALFEAAHEDDTPCPIDAQTMMRLAMEPAPAPAAPQWMPPVQWALALGLVLVSCASIAMYLQDPPTPEVRAPRATRTAPTLDEQVTVLELDWEAPTDFLFNETLATHHTDDAQMTDVLLEDHHDVF